MRKKTTRSAQSFLLASLCLVAVLVFSACKSGKPIHVAFIGSLSGSHSEVAVFIRNAVQMEVERLNSAGGIDGRPLALDVFDNEGSTDRCRAIFTKIIDDGYKFVIGPVFSQMADVTMESIRGHDILVLSPSMSADSLSGTKDNFYRIVSTSSGQGVTLAQYILDRGYRSLGVIYDERNAKYTIPLYTKLIEIVESKGVKITMIESIGAKDSVDFGPLTARTFAAPPDALVMCLSAIDGASLAQQLRKKQTAIDFLGVSWTQTNDLLEHGGRAVEGMVVISLPEIDKKQKAYIDFQSNYMRLYNREPSFPAILGHDAAVVLFSGMAQADKVAPEEVGRALLAAKQFTGLIAPIRFDPFGDIEGSYGLVRVTDNTFITLK